MCANVVVGLTVDPREIEPAVDVSVHEVQVLGHLLQNQEVPRKEQLALECGRRWVL